MGHFAFAVSLAQDTWLEITAATTTQQPELEDADHIAETCRPHPHTPPPPSSSPPPSSTTGPPMPR
ncbi:hypothetical protein [Streptomyces sp. NPDC058086]|uniref:hypothetical protein n=1 Tax=Streptomyces sp. NPDC058086 TaxID=3346334 RepID=UPI0036EC8B2B